MRVDEINIGLDEINTGPPCALRSQLPLKEPQSLREGRTKDEVRKRGVSLRTTLKKLAASLSGPAPFAEARPIRAPSGRLIGRLPCVMT